MSFTMAAAPQYRGKQLWFFSLLATLALPISTARAQSFFYYDANGHSQGKVVCTEQSCEVFANSTSIGMVSSDGTAYDHDGNRLGHTSEYGQNWRPASFWIRPSLPENSESSADPQGWSLPLDEALQSDAVGGDVDRVQVRALQAAAIAYGLQQNFVSASDTDLHHRAGSRFVSARESDPDLKTVPAVIVYDADQNAYVMLHGIWVLAIGKASNSNQVTLWWPGSDQIETAVAPLTTVVQTLNTAGIVLPTNDSDRVQHLPVHAASEVSGGNATTGAICLSGDPRMRDMVADAMQSWREMKLDCSDAGNDLVLTVTPTGRWIAVLQDDDAHGWHFHNPKTAFEAIAVLRDRAGQELWRVRKESWTGRGDRTHVAREIAKSFKKFYAAYHPPSPRDSASAKPQSRSAIAGTP